MSRVDLDKNRPALVQAFEEVSNPKNGTDWILFGYEAQTTTLKFVAKGDGGIEELVDDLSGGKIMYAYCRVKDPNTGLPKFVLINWQGEGVPEMKKGSCANHITDVSKLLKGAHITINARCDDDVDEDEIIKKVAKSSGSNYSFHKEKAQPGANAPSGPVGSVYKKIKPHIELKPDVRDKFWEKQREEEKIRQEDVQQKAFTEKQKLEREGKEREAEEGKRRDRLENERMQKIMEMKQAEKRANAPDTAAEKEKWEKTQLEGVHDEEERRKRADQLRRERQSEAQSLVHDRQQHPRSAFEQKPVSQFDEPSKAAKAPPPQRKLKHDFGSQDEPQVPVARKQPIQLPKVPSPAASPPTSPPAASPPTSPPAASPPTSPPAALPPRAEPALPPRAEPAPAPPSAAPHTRNLMAEGLPPRRDSDEDDEEQDWDVKKSPTNEPSTEDFSMPRSPAAQPPEDLYDDIQHAAPQPSEPEPQDLYDDIVAPAASNPPEDIYDDVQQDVNVGGSGDQSFAPELGVVARALYDYQATEDNEVTFDPEDLITNIDQIDPGWWVGTAPDGSQGMFPSNYVQILNG